MPDGYSTEAVIQIDPAESECLEIRLYANPPEVVVLRHGMDYPEGGEAVYSELLLLNLPQDASSD